MTVKVRYDKIDWDDPEVQAALKRYRETIDVSSPLVKDIDRGFAQSEKEARQEDFFTVLEKFSV